MRCPLCRGDLDFPALGQVVEGPHCEGQIQMPFAPPELPEEAPAPTGTSNRALWVIGGVLTLIGATAGVLLSGVLTPYFHRAASTAQEAQRPETPSDAQAEQAIRELVTRESEGRMNLVAFKKVDGQLRQLLGAPVYEMNFQAE